LVQREIKRSGFDELIASGLVVTGGTALMEGIVEAAERILDLPARRGVPLGIGGLVDIVGNPMHATGVGLIHYGVRELKAGQLRRYSNGHFFSRATHRVKEWVEALF
ncbi:MAG: cell division protein FtsA, partial [Nitrospirae bacterium]|nr:cell division protein FtsA [Nitrospirota bacterium]